MERLFTMPSGLTVAGMNAFETRVLYHEVFESDAYWRNGLQLRAGDVVFDVGANIGMFALAVADRFPGAVVHAFEPIPAVHSALAANARRCDRARIETHLYGLSKETGIESFAFDPKFTFAATSHVRELASILPGRSGPSGWREAVVEDLCITGVADDGVLRPSVLKAIATTPKAVAFFAWLVLRGAISARRVRAPVKTLTDAVAEIGPERIDLLKIDVEGAELDVLRGIAEPTWPLVRHVVVEVHDVAGRVERIRSMLESRGFEVLVEQEPRPLKRLLSMHLLYGRRR
jgi:nonribosomal peptide synthetase DhbF